MERVKPPEPGVYENVDFMEYLAWDAASNSILGVICEKSAAHAKERMDNPSVPTEALVMGKAIDMFNFEVMSFDDEFAVLPPCDRRTKAGKELYAKFLSENEGKSIITQDQYDIVHNTAAGIERHPHAKRFIWGSRMQLSMVWDDPTTGVRCKGRIDHHHASGVIADLKSTQDASPRSFSKSIYNFGYHRQAAFYTDGYAVLHDGDEQEFIFVCVEKTPPFCAATYIAGDDVLQAGRNQYRKALAIYGECQKSGVWPGYSDSIMQIHLPTWAARACGLGSERLEL